jgi:hypothetical protein
MSCALVIQPTGHEHRLAQRLLGSLLKRERLGGEAQNN